MEFRLINTWRISLLLFVATFCIFIFLSCGSSRPSNDSTATTGALSFKLAYHDAACDLQPKAAIIDCSGHGIATVEASVYNLDNAAIAAGGPWDCDDGQGTISSVPAGSNRTVVVLGKDAAENVIFSGQMSGIQIDADSEYNAGTIECLSFVPSLLAPVNESDVQGGTMVLEWAEVAGAAEYHVVVSHNSDFSNPIIDDTTRTTSFTPTGISYRKTCYWQVFAIDSYGNSGRGSDVWSFRSPDNGSPIAQITCPQDGIIYTKGDTITFTGSGSDVNDGDLIGESLVWRSDLYGPICTGETCVFDLLGAGNHQISMTATDSENVSWTDTVTITVTEGPAGGSLPDTGQIVSHTQTSGEDSDYTINAPTYTKLDASGNDLDACATEWAMVRDNVTGLIWEVKTDDGSIHDKDDVYDWEKDQAGDLDAQVDFIERLNNEAFGGKSDWRLPTVKELSTIVNRGNHSPAINTAYFPNTISDYYWSATMSARNTDNVWAVDFNSGVVYADNEWNHKSYSSYVRAVRGGNEVTGGLTDNGNNTVTDSATGLMWQKLSVIDGDGNARAMTWEEALKYCETLELAGYDDWRLPNVNELQSIVDHEKNWQAIDTTVFEHTPQSIYWTSTTYDLDPSYAWCVRFYFDGHVYKFDKLNSYKNEGTTAVMCVRAVRSVQ